MPSRAQSCVSRGQPGERHHTGLWQPCQVGAAVGGGLVTPVLAPGELAMCWGSSLAW